VKLSPCHQAIFDELKKGPQTIVNLMYAIWGTKDGPEWPYNSLRNHVSMLNKRIGNQGLRAIKKHPGRGKGSTLYQLVEISPTAPWNPQRMTEERARERRRYWVRWRNLNKETKRRVMEKKIDPFAVYPG
jgi:hypothetical protein